jgi:hypothetical protein
LENTVQNVKLIFKEMKEHPKNEFIIGVERYFKRNKKISDRQFEGLYGYYQFNFKNKT